MATKARLRLKKCLIADVCGDIIYISIIIGDKTHREIKWQDETDNAYV